MINVEATGVYSFLAIAWFVIVLIRGAYLRGQNRLEDFSDLAWYIILWGCIGAWFWPFTVCVGAGYWLGQERGQ